MSNKDFYNHNGSCRFSAFLSAILEFLNHVCCNNVSFVSFSLTYRCIYIRWMVGFCFNLPVVSACKYYNNRKLGSIGSWLLFFPLSCPRVRCIDSETTLSSLPLVYLPSMHLSFPSLCIRTLFHFYGPSLSLYEGI